MVPRGGTGRIGEQSRTGVGGAVWAGGVAGEGGDCALAAPAATVSTQVRRAVCFIRIQGKRTERADVPCGTGQTSGFAVANEGKVPHRGHRAALGQGDAAMFRGPIDQPRPWKFRPPAEPPRQRRERQFEDAARAALGADVIDQDEFAAGFQHADEIIERAFRVRHRGDDILRHHRIEERIRKRQVLGVHHRERLDIFKIQCAHALLRLAQHRLGNIDAA